MREDSFTNRNTGIEKTAHQTLTERKENRTASVAPANPNVSGLSTIHTLAANRIPPPKYPKENPRAETESILFSDATLVISES